MAFDIDKYLATQLAPTAGVVPVTDGKVSQNKVDELTAKVKEASQIKIIELGHQKNLAIEQRAQEEAARAASENSWSTQLGLEPEGFMSNRVNDVASLVSGAGRLAGHIASLPVNALGAAVTLKATPADYEAYNRALTGKATAEDKALLNRPISPETSRTILSGFRDAEKLRGTSRDINNFFNLSGIVEQTNRNQLNDDLGSEFQGNWDKVTKGWDQATHNNFAKGAGSIVSGMAGLMLNAGEAVVTNPSAAREYIIENVPQLFVGALGKTGQAAMAASNMGYAADYYQKGIEKYAAENGGQLPPEEQRQRMAVLSASLALAEHAGEHASLAFMKKGVAADTTGVASSLQRTAAAAGKGLVTEAATEGYQTFAEGEVSGEPASAQDIYTGAVIGGVAGAGLSGGGHAINEMLGATPAQQAKKANDAQVAADTQQTFNDATNKNDVAVYTDPKSKDYDLAKGMGALLGHAMKEDTTPEVKQANLKQAGQLLSDLEDQHAKAKEAVDERSPEGVKRAQAQLATVEAEIFKTDPQNTDRIAELSDLKELLGEQITDLSDTKEAEKARTAFSKLDRQLTAGRNYMDGLVNLNEKVATPEEVSTLVAQVSGKTTSVQADINTDTDTSTSASADRLINLSMTQPDTLSSNDALKLADDASNSLTDVQRAHLRVFSEARIAENELSTTSKVSQEVLYGSDKNVGITQYRSRITKAITADNKKSAELQLGMLGDFAADHADKAATAKKAIAQYGLGAQILKTSSGWEAYPKGTQTDKVLRSNGGLALNSGRLIQDIAKEAVALKAAHVEMKSATSLKFGVQSVSPTEQAVSPSNSNSPKNEEDTARPELRPEATTAKPSPATKKVEPKQAAAEQPAAVSEANPAPVAEAAPAEAEVVEKVEKKHTLKVFDAAHDAAVPYTEQNLIGTKFKQNAGDTGTQRPLAKVADFLSALKNKTTKVSDSVQQKTDFSDEQRAVLRHFVGMATAWKDTITGNLTKGNKGYGQEDLIQFLMDEQGDLDENVKTAIAYAAYSWVAENAARPAINTNEEINLILGRGEDALVGAKERNALEHVGTRQNVVANSLGQRVTAALGLKPLASAPRNLQADLEASIGAHAMKLLLDQGILIRTTISGKEMAALTGSDDTQTNAKFYFLKLARTEAGDLNEKAETIYQSNKGTKGILDKLFGVEPALKEPNTEPVKPTQKTTRNTSQGIPSELAKQVANDDAEANFVRQDMYNLAGQINPDILLQIAGKEEGGKTVHKGRRLSIEAKNNGLVRELDRFMGYVGQMGSDVAMYFEHSVWMQQRVGIATNLINPQTSKIHRHMLYRASWETEISTKASDELTNFKLRVAEGLGVKTDKKNQEKALADFTALMAKPEIKGAVAVLVKSLEGPDNGKLSDNDQQVLLAGVKTGGENMHSLDALMALAQFTLAKKGGKPTFKTQMMAEVDGVTNGPMLSHLLLGAANDVKEMYALLNRGGFFEQGNAHTEYNNWRDAPGNFDLYENTALHMTQAINAAGFDQTTMASIYAFTGELADSKGVVQKAGRNIIKTPLTAMVFGSSVNNAVDSMADNFVDAIYDAIEKGDLTNDQIRSHLTNLGVQLPAGIDLMEHEFTPAQTKALKGMFKETLGKAVEETMKADFAVFISQRTEFNKTAQLNFEVYNAVYTGMREQKIADLIKSGEIAVNKTTGLPLHDLTNAQEKELREQVAALAPIMHSPLSKESNDLSSGLLVAKSDRKLSTSDVYQNTVKFGQPFADGSKSTSVHGYEVTPTGPGVGMVPVSMHSSDSAISVRANPDGKALNVHDAQGHGVGGIIATAQAMNAATWNTMLNYSPAAEITAALLRTVRGLDGLLKAGNVPDVVISKLAVALVDFAAKHEVAAEGVLHLQAELAQAMAYRADTMKLDTMAEMQAVNQYAMERGAFAVTPEHRSSAASLRSALEVGLSADDRSALTSVGDKLDAAIKAELAKRDNKTVVAADPEMDKPSKASEKIKQVKLNVKPNAKLLTLFDKGAVITVKEAIAGLQAVLPNTTRQDEFNQRLLRVIQKTMLSDVSVRLVTSDTAAGDLLRPMNAGALGAYVSNTEGKHEINLRGSTLTPEVMLHELTHAALARTIANPTEATKPLIKELDELLVEARAFADKAGIKDQYAAALKDVQELVAWGMTNTAFQNDVLNKIQMSSANTANPLVTGIQKFIASLVKLVFGRPNDNMNTGMTVLITNVSGLFTAASQTAATTNAEINQSMVGSIVRDLSTIDIYAALEQSNNGATVSPDHSAHLQKLLTTLVQSVYGPFGSFKAAMMEQTAQDPLDIYTEALRTGVAPFASESLAAGFAFTDQEAFVLEQVEATMRTALESKDGVITIAYKELTKLYSEVRAKVKVENFHKGDWATATQMEKDQAQSLYDFVFAIKQDATGKSDYMSRFAALGLVHSGFRELLQFYTSDAAANPNMSFNERLNRIFNTIMSWVAGKMTDTFRGQRADHKLHSLVQQMIGIEAKKRNKIESQSKLLTSIQDSAEDMSVSVRTAIEKFGKKPFFQNAGNEFVKLAGNTLSAVAGDRVDAIMEGYQKLRDKTMTGQLGVAASLVNEVRGATSVTQVYHYLLRGTKHLEGVRKNTITNISKAVSGSFMNEGEDLTNDHKKAMTAVVLRGDMHALMGQYNTQALHNMVRSKTAVQTEITAHEVQLTGKMSRFYITSAKALGFYLATGKITVAHQLFNAGNIARLYGTGMGNQVTEADAKTAEQIIDRLASLYAIKYANKTDLKLLDEVFTAEAARTDGGNGIEMIMKTHAALQAESKDKLFANSEALMMKGYVPEIYDPYMSVVMATEEQGAELELRGYVAVPGYLGQDVADPFNERKRIYSLRDGGMKQWNSGIFSTTDTRAKGNRVIQGAAAISAAGQQNAVNMAAIAAGKRAGIQAMFMGTAFDPAQVKETHMAPVLNPNGDITNYRYMMSNHVKDNLLNRDNRTDRLLGSLAGNMFDKVTSVVQNQNAIKALHDQYRADFVNNADSYLTVGPTSSDPQLREIWYMLPRDTQIHAKALFGRDGLKVRNDVLDINFGYRKLSIGTVFDKETYQRSFVENMFVEIMTHAFKEKAQLRTRQVEDIWQAIVKETKANLVVKSWSTMSGNLRSNWSQLFLMGVSPVEILKGHRVAFKSAWEYKQDSAKLFSLQHQQKIGHLEPGQTPDKVAYQIKRLEDALARNPIRPLIDAGLMPTIVEDVSVDEDIYSYKSRFTEKLDNAVDSVNPHILKGIQFMTMHHSTAPYKVMSYATQISDFLARYTLYQHDISKKNPLSHDEAVQRASESFINYDVPTHRKIQYANDSGLIMFSKYYVRIQKILARIYKDSPGRVLALIAAEHMLGDQPTVLDSSFTSHFGNPFNAGALNYIGSLDSVTTVGLVISPFTTTVYNGQ